MSNKFTLKKTAFSFYYAAKGLKIFFSTQANAFIHLLGLGVMIVLGFYFNINNNEWLALIIAAGIVFITEMLNTAIEFLTDHVSPEYHVQAGRVKDVAAGAVLLAAVTALVIAAIVFIPKL